MVARRNRGPGARDQSGSTGGEPHQRGWRRRNVPAAEERDGAVAAPGMSTRVVGQGCGHAVRGSAPVGGRCAAVCGGHRDRKSTRLNSSHTVISYAVFCLKKKKDP